MHNCTGEREYHKNSKSEHSSIIYGSLLRKKKKKYTHPQTVGSHAEMMW